MKIIIIGITLLMGTALELNARIEMVHVRDDFDKIIADNDLVVSFIYSLPNFSRKEVELPDGTKGQTPEMTEALRKINIIGGISEDPAYDNVVFMASNLDRGDMKNLRQDYNLIGDMIMVIRKGHVLAKRTVTDALMPADVKHFLLQSNLGDFAEAALRAQDKKEEERRERRSKRRPCSTCVSFGLGFGYGYPGWPYGWYGPSYYNSGPWPRVWW